MINRRITSIWLLVVPNFILFYLALWATMEIRYRDGFSQQQFNEHLFHFTFLHLMWLVVFLGMHLFERETYRRFTTLVFALLSAMGINLLVAIGYFYWQPELLLTPRRFLLMDVALVFVFVLIWNLIIKELVFKRMVQPIYLLSVNGEMRNLESEISKRPYLGFNVIGHIQYDQLQSLPTGSIVVFSDNLSTNPELASQIFQLRNQGIKFHDHNFFYEVVLRRVHSPSLNTVWFLQNIAYGRKIFYEIFKLLFDAVAGIILFAVFAATFVFIFALIKLSSSGPVFFKQERTGKNGKIFNIYKYRTMVHGSRNNTWTEDEDSRITKVGRILRLLRLDELPQAMNILNNEMSIVGPRPEQVHFVEQLKQELPYYDERHIVKPGITGWAQLNIYAATLEETRLKLEYDIYYIKHRSLLFDIEIILKTLYKIITLQGK